ncbi:hypothetical protein [Clostridium sp.]|uniref:hypothetical protein n=1 Tax=Clostridium sp. TaxID=1506 RepID=UPI001D3E52CB|nr:hypothetical protein [Clostridium sp.]MBS5937743.1 hypothetical protein [Clostridium sp.]
MKTNCELLNEVFKEMNEEYDSEILSIEHVDDCLSISYKREEVIKIFEETLEEFEEPIKIIITSFYNCNRRAKSKEYVKQLDKYSNTLFKKILKSNDDEEILNLVDACKEIKAEKDSLKDNLKWTKEVARNLYLSQELFIEKFDDEVI